MQESFNKRSEGFTHGRPQGFNGQGDTVGPSDEVRETVRVVTKELPFLPGNFDQT